MIGRKHADTHRHQISSCSVISKRSLSSFLQRSHNVVLRRTVHSPEWSCGSSAAPRADVAAASGDVAGCDS